MPDNKQAGKQEMEFTRGFAEQEGWTEGGGESWENFLAKKHPKEFGQRAHAGGKPGGAGIDQGRAGGKPMPQR